MSTRKIIFFIIVGIIGILLIYMIWNLSQERTNQKASAVQEISIWVVGDTSEQYSLAFSEFGSYDKRYKNTQIAIRVFPDYEQYKKILLSTLAQGSGPDLFMIEGGGDDILASKILPVPESFMELSDFEKRYEDIFFPLLQTEGKGDALVRSILGAPLGYETLGMFYHKSLLRRVPQTWAEIETLSLESVNSLVLPINIGLGPQYTPSATDIISYFLVKNKVYDTKGLLAGSNGLSEYLSYADIPAILSNGSEDGGIQETTLTREKSVMNEERLTTLDLFMRGKIAIVIGFPSMIREIEKAEKRAGNDLFESIILTDRLPRERITDTGMNIARYKYLGISANTKYPEASAHLLSYIMSDTGERKIREAFPLLISPIRANVEAQKNTPLSTVFARTRLDPFIPKLDDKLYVYNYGIKSEYENIFRENIDRSEKINTNIITKQINKNVTCDLESIIGGTISDECLQKEE